MLSNYFRFESFLPVALLCAGGAAVAQADYPARPIRFLVGVVPGGAADTLARAVGQRYAAAFHQQVIVDNRPGANQTIAADLTAKAAPDGYTIVIVAAGHAISPALYKLPYDAQKDFSAIGFIAAVPNVFVVHPGLGVRTVKDFIALARAKPGALAYGSSGIGSASHLSTELFQMMTQLTLVHVPYKGQGLAMIDLIGGQLQFGFPSVPASIQYIKSGRMIALAVASKERSSALPDVPPLGEAGVPGYEVSGWYGVLGPAKLPHCRRRQTQRRTESHADGPGDARDSRARGRRSAARHARGVRADHRHRHCEMGEGRQDGGPESRVMSDE